MRITGRTRVFAILGDPVGHSLSPAMQNAAFQSLGLEAAYVPVKCAPGAVAGLVASLSSAGGGGNVTIPHKTIAVRALTQPSAWVRAIDACNTFWGDESAEIHGDNTDIAGVLGALDALKVPAGPWLLAGTGGSARAVAAAARERGVALAVTSRDADRQGAFAAWAADTLGVAAAEPRDCRVLINATPLGLHEGDPDPVAPTLAPHAGAVLDLVYRRGETDFVRRARARGLLAADGREVLVRQGAAAFTRWFPAKRPPVDVMRAAVNAILG